MSRTAEHGEFLLSNGTRLTPETFGLMAVKLAIGDTVADVEAIVGNQETAFRKSIAAKVDGILLNLVALQTAALVVYAEQYLATPLSVLHEMHKGIIKGFDAWSEDADSKAFENRMSKYLDIQFILYVDSLTKELLDIMSSQPEDIGFDIRMGPTASLVAKNIALASNVQNEMLESDLDKYHVEYVAAECGIKYLLNFGKLKPITYIQLAQPVAASIGELDRGNHNPQKEKSIPGYTPLSTGNKIFLAVLAIWIALAASKQLFQY